MSYRHLLTLKVECSTKPTVGTYSPIQWGIQLKIMNMGNLAIVPPKKFRFISCEYIILT